jgi:hypothetical protein
VGGTRPPSRAGGLCLGSCSGLRCAASLTRQDRPPGHANTQTSARATRAQPTPRAPPPRKVVIGTHGRCKAWVSDRVLDLDTVRILVFDEADEMLKADAFADESGEALVLPLLPALAGSRAARGAGRGLAGRRRAEPTARRHAVDGVATACHCTFASSPAPCCTSWG